MDTILDTEHVIRQSGNIYTRMNPIYKFIHVTYYSSFVMKMKYSYSQNTRKVTVNNKTLISYFWSLKIVTIIIMPLVLKI